MNNDSKENNYTISPGGKAKGIRNMCCKGHIRYHTEKLRNTVLDKVVGISSSNYQSVCKQSEFCRSLCFLI